MRALAALLILPWAFVQARIRVPDDAVWLTGAAGKFLDGIRMTDGYYDTNPPMSFMIYVPAALLAQAGVPVWYVVVFYGMALAALSVFLCAKMGVRGGVLAAFVVATTMASQYEFAQKDHLIALMLFPFLLAQYAMTYRQDVPKWAVRVALIAGAPFILLKPHYGLLPVLMLAYRAWREKNLRVVFGFDFFALAAGTVLYAAAIALWFRDFITAALGHSIESYILHAGDKAMAAPLGLFLLSACLLVLALAADGKGDERRLAVFLNAMTLAAVLPLLVQMKGFSVHMLPALGFAFPAAAVTAGLYGGNKFRVVLRYSAPLVLFLGYLVFPPPFSYPTHAGFADTSLARFVREKAQGSSFLIQSSTTNVIAATSAYTGIPVASRFPSFWFMPFSDDGARKSFAGMAGADLAAYRPSLVMLYAEPPPGQDVTDVFAGDPGFAREWGHYRRDGQFTLDYAEYYGGSPHRAFGRRMILYDVYVRGND